ncbi:MAG: hypothetical protein ABSH53_02250 [Holophaga sp.]|jgi:hypothetical protein
MNVQPIPYALRFASRPTNPAAPAPVQWNAALKGYTPVSAGQGPGTLSDPTRGLPTQFGPIEDAPMGDAPSLEFYG